MIRCEVCVRRMGERIEREEGRSVLMLMLIMYFIRWSVKMYDEGN